MNEPVKHSEITFQLMVESSPNALMLVNKEGKIAFANQQIQKLFGYTRNELIGQNVEILIPPRFTKGHPAHRNMFFASPEPRAMGAGRDLFALRKDKTEFPVEIGLNPVVTVDGTLVLAAIIDISERKKFEEKQALYASIVNSSDDAILSKNLDGIITSWNKGAEKVFGYNAADIIGKHISLLIPSHLRGEEAEILAKIKNGQNVDHYETERLRKDGHTIYASLTISPIKDLYGNIIGASKISRDITERKRAEQELLKANRLYALLSGVNQSIVHSKDEQTLLNRVSRVAIETGKFKGAQIGMLDEHDGVVMQIANEDENTSVIYLQYSGMDFRIPPLCNTTTGKALLTGQYVINNDMRNDPDLVPWNEEMKTADIKSGASFPIKRSGQLAGVFNFFSSEKNFFDDKEIALLEEAVGDVSFALEIFENEKLRRRAELQLEQNEARLEKAQSVAHIGHWQMNFATGLSLWSDESCRIYGLDTTDNVHTFDSWASFIHPDDKEATLNFIKKSEASLKNFSFDHRIIRDDGDIRYIHAECQFEFEVNGKPTGLYGISHDVTEQKLAEEAIKRSAANFTAIIENTTDNIYSLDTNFRYLTFNSSLKNSLQQVYRLDIKPGDNVYEFLQKLDPAEAKDWESRYREALTGKTLQFVKEFAVGDFHSFHSFSINPIWENKRVIGLSCFARDITQQKLAEAEIIALNESLEKKVKERTAELQDANKELEAFSYTVSHDLQSPLRTLNGFSKILINEYADKLGAKGQEYLSILADNARHMNELIKDLLHFSKLGKEPIKKKEVNMNELVAVVISEIKTVNRNFKAEMNLRPLKTSHCDQGLIKQVWANLISNAVKYSSKKEKPVVEIGAFEQNGELVYYIKDNGAGFDMQHADKLFAVFHRLHSPTEFEGTGVGLATVQRIITRHGGRIWAEGKPGEGATFYFTLAGM